MVIAFGAALNQWTTRHGTLISPSAQVIQVDRDEEAIGAHRPVHLGVVGDAAATAGALLAALDGHTAAPAARARGRDRRRRLAARAVRGERPRTSTRAR